MVHDFMISSRLCRKVFFSNSSIFRLLLSANGHGHRLPRVRLSPQQDRQADDLRLLVAGLPDVQRNDGEKEKEVVLRMYLYCHFVANHCTEKFGSPLPDAIVYG